MVRLVCIAALCLTSTGCFTGGDNPLPETFGQCDEPPAPGMPPAGTLTYYEHAKPIFDAMCADCHATGGIAPFPLETYEDAMRFSTRIRAAVASGAMPPWQPDDCCTDYRWDLSLTPDQKATILGWLDQGGLPGSPDDEPPPLDVDRGGLSRVDKRFSMVEPFQPKPVIGADEVRCFVLDGSFDGDSFVRGINVVPGNRSMVHHVIVMAVAPDLADELARKQGKDGRPGWDCVGELETDRQRTAQLGGWTPGSRGIEYPDGLGRSVPAGWKVVLNMHYDTGTSRDPDQTHVDVMIDDHEGSQLRSVPVINPLWLAGDAMAIPAHSEDTSVFFSYDPTTVLTQGRPFLIYAVNHHMHELGSIARLAILRADGSTDCLLNITNWDFDWLGDYWLAQPIRFDPGDELFIECHWNNTAARQKFVGGEQIAPRDIAWGTDEEMCAGILTVTYL